MKLLKLFIVILRKLSIVSHSNLIDVLGDSGFRVGILSWVANFLNGRVQHGLI